MNLNWSEIHPLNGSKADAFEELCAQLARAQNPSDAAFTRKAPPDAGVECFTVLNDGSEWAWQAKYFTTLGSSQFDQIDKSVRTALKKHPKLTRYYICVPLNRSDARTEGRKSAMDRWNTRLAKWKGWADDSDMDVEFVWWGSSELLEMLALPEHVGRVFFWFGERRLDKSWLNARLREAVRAAGPRYTPEIHVELPITVDFECFGRTEASTDSIKARAKAIRKAFQVIDAVGRDDPSRSVSMDRLQAAVDVVLQSLAKLTPDPSERLPYRRILALVRDADSAANDYCTQLSRVHRAAQTLKKDDSEQFKRNPFTDRINRVNRFRRTLDGARGALEHSDNLSNKQLLVLTGNAGTGKTHLLCDFAQSRLASGAPTILLMGQRFTSPGAPWRQALQQLDLRSTTTDQFVGALEAAAQAAGTRAVLIVDAINEGQGRVIWPPNLAAFLDQITTSPWIGMLLSVRSTYKNVVIPREILENSAVLTHRGFADHEYDATRALFQHYGLELSSTPILQPEFRNPLFLKTICQGLVASGRQRMPRGFHGITAAFDLYLRATNDRLATDLGYNGRDQLVQRGLAGIARLLAKAVDRRLTRNAAVAEVDQLLPGREFERSLYHGLVTSGLLVEDIVESRDDEPEDIVYFAYERYADHAIVNYLLQTHLDLEAPEAAFTARGGLAYMSEEDTYVASGILEALCIQLPERTGMELPRLAPALSKKWGMKDAFRQSLIWRRLDAFSPTTIDVLNELQESEHDSDDTLDALLTVASIPDHALNAEFLDKNLRHLSMPDRDAWWSTYLHRAWGTRGAVDRIVNWASDVSPDDQLDAHVIELSSMVLAWMLTTSNRFLRDRATKSLVALLTDRLGKTQSLVERFADVDDPYVTERVFAVAYGVAMRSTTPDEVGALAAAVYRLVFLGGHPSPHILLRDYARGVIERALYLGSRIDVDSQLIRPPYKSEWPEIPSDSDLEPLMPDWGQPSASGRNFGWSHNRIVGSVTADDFAWYVIGRETSITSWLSRRLDQPRWRSGETRMKKFLSTLGEASQEAWDEYRNAVDASIREQAAAWSQAIQDNLKHSNAGETQSSVEIPRFEPTIDAALSVVFENFRNDLSAEERHAFDSILLDWQPVSQERPPRFESGRIQRYIIGRVFDLGWTTERFGDFDRYEMGFSGREAAKAERIGKKYQWIAYHEILAHICDHYQYHERYQEDKEDHAYDGPWQESLRNIDPSMTLPTTPGGTGWDDHEPSWWGPTEYSAWREDLSATDWMKREDDIPDVAALFAPCHPNTGTRWINLDGYFAWAQRHSADVESWDIAKRRFWLHLTGYLVPKNKAAEFMTWAKGVDFWGRWMPNPPQIHGMFLGEYGWSPAFRYYDGLDEGLNDWIRPGRGCPVSVRTTTFDFLYESGGFDCSLNESFTLRLPQVDLLNQLKLTWTGRCADFVDDDSELAAFDPATREAGPTALLVREDVMRRYLRESNTALCWTVLGEKTVIGGRNPDYQGSLRISGAYSFHAPDPVGFCNLRYDEPR